MNYWRQLFNQKKAQERNPSIIDESITGVGGNNNSPNSLFYSEFSEADVESFFIIFDKYKNNHESDEIIRIQTLQNNLITQINSMSCKKVCPIESLLYAANSISDLITCDDKLFNAIKKIVAIIIPKYEYDCVKVAWYIMSGWDWTCPIEIFVEAVGDVNNDQLVKLIMEFYPRIAKLASSIRDWTVLKSFLNMLVYTQNDSYAEYFVKIVSNKSFTKDNELIEYFIKIIERIQSSNPDTADEILNMLEDAEVPFVLRERIKQMINKRKGKNGRRPSSVSGISFGPYSSSAIKLCKNIQDYTQFNEICEKIMDSINDIYPDEYTSEAYIILGTKGKNCREQVELFLSTELRNKPLFELPIKTALYELDFIGPSELFDSIFECQENDDVLKSIGNYFRFRSLDFNNKFLRYLLNKDDLSFESEEKIYNYVNRLEKIIHYYDGWDGKLGNNADACEKMLKLMSKFLDDYENIDIYIGILKIIDIVASYNSQRNSVLEFLDYMKDLLCETSKYSVIIHEINDRRKKYDTNRPGEKADEVQ